ncbi:MAG: ribonuclease Z [Promethearchaeota archaeon]
MKIIFLGTGAAVPSKTRKLSSIVIQRKNEILVFDAGEGLQYQLREADINIMKITKIFISHLHGDHIFGLPGLILTLKMYQRKKPLYLYGPPGILQFLVAVNFISGVMDTEFELLVQEIGEGLVVEEKEYWVKATLTDHGIYTLAYSITEKSYPGKFFPEKARALGIPEGPLWSKLKAGESVQLNDGRIINSSEVVGPTRPGKKITYSGDTRPTKSIILLSQNSDVLIHEATFDDTFLEKAKQTGHATAGEAAKIAKDAGVKQLILTHISTRYKDTTILYEQAKKIFPSTIVAEDFMVISLNEGKK